MENLTVAARMQKLLELPEASDLRVFGFATEPHISGDPPMCELLNAAKPTIRVTDLGEVLVDARIVESAMPGVTWLGFFAPAGDGDGLTLLFVLRRG